MMSPFQMLTDRFFSRILKCKDGQNLLRNIGHIQSLNQLHGGKKPFERKQYSTIKKTETLKVYSTLESFNEYRNDLFLNRPLLSVGFVPTMGALHEGHMSLYERARSENDVVVASVFVNPTQFGPNEDFDRYPRMPEKDCSLLEDALVDAVIMPSTDQMYKENHRNYVVPEGYDELPEGSHRPGHFRGVATVVTKLLNIVRPHRSYFGQKDALQSVVIKQLVSDLHLPGQVVICPTVRESDGLALSSRNAYLTGPGEREAATVLFKALTAMQQHWEACISKDRESAVSSSVLLEKGMRILQSEPLVSKIDYLSVGSKVTMEELDEVTQEGAIISVALKLGKVRLIDNFVL